MRVSPDGLVRARAPMTGLGVRFAPLVLEDGGLAVVAASRTLALVGSDLEVRRIRELPDGLALTPTRTSSGRWAVAAGAELVLVDPHTFEIARTLPLPGRAAASPAVAPDGTLWVATVDGALVRVRGELRMDSPVALGARLPEATTSERTTLAIAEDGDVLVVVPTRGLVRLAPDGTERWTWTSETPLVSAVSVDETGRAVVIDRVGHLSVIDAQASVEWTTMLGALPLGPAQVTPQGRVVVLTERSLVLLGPE
jgi:outer membrane protein assembly factor BamB